MSSDTTLINKSLSDEANAITRRLEDGSRVTRKYIQVATFVLAGAVVAMVAWWSISRAGEAASMAGIDEATLNPVLVAFCGETGEENHGLSANEIKTLSFDNGFVFFTFEGSLPTGTSALVELWVRDGKEFVIGQFQVCAADIKRHTIYSAPIGVPRSALVGRIDEWSIGADITINGDHAVKYLDEIILAY